MDFKSYLEKNAHVLDLEIDQILTQFLNEVKKLNPKLIPFAIALINSCKGGKRIRGTLVKLGYELANSDSGVAGAPQNDIVKIGAAYEILHASILIHDDVIDQSKLRRGKLTLYEALRPKDGRVGGNHYGISQAIGLGDVGLFLPIKLIADCNFLGEYKIKALSFFAQTITNTGWGQILDVELPHLGGERKEEDVISIHKLKTSQYTISGPLIMGAILAGAESDSAGAEQEMTRDFGEFGENLGIAFQIQDDILGVFGSEDEIGKSTSSDIEEGKNTLLFTEALKRANPKQKAILDKYYGQANLEAKGLEEIRKIFEDTGSLDYSRQFAVKYVEFAKKVIPRITKNKTFIKLLTEMADFLVERSS